MFYYYILFQLTNEIISLLKQITAITTLYTLQTNKVAYRACRARGDGRVAFALLVVTCCDVLCRVCCTACASQYAWLFHIPKCMG